MHHTAIEKLLNQAQVYLDQDTVQAALRTLNQITYPKLSPSQALRYHHLQGQAFFLARQIPSAFQTYAEGLKRLDPAYTETHALITDYFKFLESLQLFEYLFSLLAEVHQLYPEDAFFQMIERRIRQKIERQMHSHYSETSNLSHWQALQAQGYFKRHPYYQNSDASLRETGTDVQLIEQFTRLDLSQKVIVIGCGYGRESALLAPQVGTVYGIDVSPEILQQASDFLRKHKQNNFVPVLASEWKSKIPTGIDLVYCFTVFQHLTKFLVQDYLLHLAPRLSPNGSMVLQFMQSTLGTFNAELANYEPQVTWSTDEIEYTLNQAGLQIKNRASHLLPDGKTRWHWIHAIKSRT